jgi:UDP:flavonoid glycosyltransferase YjiC (YdhE family)
MARIVVTTAGTLGDFVPFLALARGLRVRGHDAVMCVNPAMVPLSGEAGVPAVPCGAPFGAEQARHQSEVFEGPLALGTAEVRAHLRRLDLKRVYHELAAACRGADLLVSSSLQGVAGWIHEATKIRWINGTIFPMEFRHEGDPPRQEGPARGVRRELFDYRNCVRAELGLRAVPDHEWRTHYWSPELVLVASSAHLSRPILSALPSAHVTGFWFDDRTGSSEPTDTGDPALDEFLANGDEPLVLTLSSQVVKDSAHVTALHALAAQRIGRRLIVQKGWAGLGPEALPRSVDPERTYFAGFVRHERLFPRVAAVIHHGGVGTMARAMQCGRPMLVEPYCNDQFFNARRVTALGVGGSADPLGLTAETVADVLQRIVLTEETRRRAAELSVFIRAEPGVTRAVELIERRLSA